MERKSFIKKSATCFFFTVRNLLVFRYAFMGLFYLAQRQTYKLLPTFRSLSGIFPYYYF